jgi:hypothetical protein
MERARASMSRGQRGSRLAVLDELGVALDLGADDGRLHGESFAQRAGEAEPLVGGVHAHVARRENLRNIVTVERG